jgi:hypothetical protein
VLRKLLIGGVGALALVFATAVQAAPVQTPLKQTLLPGVTYERAVQFTPHGPVALHVVTGPRPTGLYALQPVLSNETIPGTERVTSMQKRLSAQATMVGVNGDMFNWSSGRPSGVLIRNGIVDNPPFGDRSSVGITPDGGIDVRRVEFFGTWKGLGQRRSLSDMNQLPGANGISLFTPSYGPATPAQAGAVAAVIQPLPPAAPNTDLAGPVVQLTPAGSVPIPPDGAVLVARGTSAQRLAEEAFVGTPVALRIIFRPEWTGVTNAIGGGPVIVRNRAPVFRSLEAFTSTQLLPRNPRTAVGQLADGRIVLVATDGRRAGYSVGMTNFELAQTMVRLGAVTASALDAGGSTTVAFDGQLLNRPSDPGGERAVATSLQLMYYGVYSPAVIPVVSPNGDGMDEGQRLSYKVVRPSSVTATLTAPDGSVAFTEVVQREPGSYDVAFPPVPLDPAAQPAAPAEGRWQLTVTSTDDLARPSTARQTFRVNNTLGFVRLASSRIVIRQKGGQRLRAGVTLTRPARVVATIETPSGVRVSTAAIRNAPAGRFTLQWPGTTNGGRSLVYSGRYVLRFRAVNQLGAVELTSRPFTVIRAAVKPKPKNSKASG